MQRFQTRTIHLTELVEWLKSHSTVYYQAPLDRYPVRVEVVRYTISNRDLASSKATLWTAETQCFTVNLASHLDRFRLPEVSK